MINDFLCDMWVIINNLIMNMNLKTDVIKKWMTWLCYSNEQKNKTAPEKQRPSTSSITNSKQPKMDRRTVYVHFRRIIGTADTVTSELSCYKCMNKCSMLSIKNKTPKKPKKTTEFSINGRHWFHKDTLLLKGPNWQE